MNTIWCFGDSNTYGYDPRGFFGGRYDAPWPELLEEKTGFEVINDGRNGRMMPVREYELRQFRKGAAPGCPMNSLWRNRRRCPDSMKP